MFFPTPFKHGYGEICPTYTSPAHVLHKSTSPAQVHKSTCPPDASAGRIGRVRRKKTPDAIPQIYKSFLSVRTRPDGFKTTASSRTPNLLTTFTHGGGKICPSVTSTGATSSPSPQVHKSTSPQVQPKSDAPKRTRVTSTGKQNAFVTSARNRSRRRRDRIGERSRLRHP